MLSSLQCASKSTKQRINDQEVYYLPLETRPSLRQEKRFQIRNIDSVLDVRCSIRKHAVDEFKVTAGRGQLPSSAISPAPVAAMERPRAHASSNAAPPVRERSTARASSPCGARGAHACNQPLPLASSN